MQQLTDLPPAVLRALEDLLRRVLRAPHGIDLAAVSTATRREVGVRRQRRAIQVTTLLVLGAALVLAGWFSAALVG